MAEQEKPVRRRVALKVIKLGMDTKQVIARFEAERQALAMMDHPNIARVFDAGATETGRPYFVMELVRGISITEYCDVNRLTTNQRLELFVPVCQAIHHAHQKGVIHRDIKPSNVLVTLHDGVPVPKVIDFGIAKATSSRLTEKTLFTEFRQFIGTPAYVSPEQAEMSGLDIDTRSDIYSLGVLLYELLTGSTPFDPKQLHSAAYDEIQRIIREVEPPRPSTRLSTLGAPLTKVAASRKIEPKKLSQLLRGDLDWIVMKALEKDRTRRYETPNDLARDIRRHLNEEAIEACPPSVIYRARRFVRRNRITVFLATALAVMAVVAIGIYVQGIRMERRKTSAALVVATVAGTEADRQRQRADEASRQYQRTAASLALDRGINFCEQQDVPRGLLWLARGLEMAGPDNPDLQWDGHRLITGDHADQLCMWDWASGRIERKVHLQTDTPPFSMALNPDATRVLVGQEGPEAGVWDVATGMPVGAPISVGNGQSKVAWSPDGSTLATGTEDRYRVESWDAATLRRVGPRIRLGGGVGGLDFGPDSRLVVTGSWGEMLARVVDVRTGNAIGPSLEQGGGVLSCRFAPDGKTVAVGAGDGKLRIWDFATGKLLGPAFQHPTRVRAIAFSRDGSRIATGGSKFPILSTNGPPDGARIWPMPTPIGGDADSVSRRIESLTGLRLLRDGAVHRLTPAEWEQNRNAPTVPAPASTQ